MKKKKEYSGPFLWFAMASFVMPAAVAVLAFKGLPQPYTYPEIKVDASGVDQHLWDNLLRTYVADGLVDYDGLKRTHLFKDYISQIANAGPSKLANDAERLAFYCNAYNALVINAVLIHKVDNSVMTDVTNAEGEGGVFFGLREHIVAGKLMSLDELEKGLILPTYNNDPRLHMVLVCAAKSCPALRPEAYLGDKVEDQFQDQAKLFSNTPSQVRYDATEKTLHVSKLLSWYGSDFGGQEGYLKFFEERSTDPSILEGIAAVKAGQAKVAFNDYNWDLNTQGKVEASSGNASFGSGSIPNE